MTFSLSPDEIFTQYPFLLTAIWLTAIAVTAVLVERIISRWVKSFMIKADLTLHAGNAHCARTERYADRMPRKPEYELAQRTSFSRNFVFYIRVKDPRDVSRLQPSILKDITEL